MPAELVEASHGDESFAIRVGWSSEASDVQVASITRDDRSMWWVLLGYNAEALAALGAQIRKAEQVTYDDDEQRARSLLNTLDVMLATYGLHVSLDRRGLNRLIRLLRKARDAAFGRDE